LWFNHVILHGMYIDIYPVWNTENLFHYKAEQSKYSIKPVDYGKKPSFIVDKDSNTYLNLERVLLLRVLPCWTLAVFAGIERSLPGPSSVFVYGRLLRTSQKSFRTWT
jgi:hypothetical protein